MLLVTLLAPVVMAEEPPPSIQSPRLGALARSLAAGDREAAAAFWREIHDRHTPLIESVPDATGQMLVTFLWRAQSEQQSVNVGVSEVGEDDPADPAARRLEQVPHSDVWFRTYRMSSQARFSYYLMWPQGREPHPQVTRRESYRGVTYEHFLDPLNPRSFTMRWIEKSDAVTWVDPSREISYAEGPNALPEPYATERKAVRRGKVVTLEMTSAILGNVRKVSIYTPPGADRGAAACDFLLLFDRAAYLSGIPTPTVLDNMLADGEIHPTVAVLIGNAEAPARGVELPPNPRFQRFLREELLPWIRERYRFTADPRRSAVGGASYGGLAAAYTAFMNPDVFGNVLSQSGSYWWWPEYRDDPDTDNTLSAEAGWVSRQYVAAPTRPLKLYMDVGAWEGSLMLIPNRTFRDALRAKGYDVTYAEFAGGHDFIAWRSTFPAGLRALLGK